MKFLSFLSIAGLIATNAAAQQQQTSPPPCQEDVYRAFDFWAGEWEVFNPQGKHAGHNSITVEEGGCLLIEHWQGAQGGTGQSYNFYDPGLKKWRQVWVSPGATIDYAGELNDEGAIVLEGEIAYRAGTTFPFRGTWTPNEDGSVTQYFQQYNPETEKWDDWFTGIYKKQEKE